MGRERLNKPTVDLVAKGPWSDSLFVELTPLYDAVLELGQSDYHLPCFIHHSKMQHGTPEGK